MADKLHPSADDMRIRAMIEEDIAPVASLYRDMYREQATLGMVMRFRDEDVESMLAAQLKSRLYICLVAEAADGSAESASCRSEDSPADSTTGSGSPSSSADSLADSPADSSSANNLASDSMDNSAGSSMAGNSADSSTNSSAYRPAHGSTGNLVLGFAIGSFSRFNNKFTYGDQPFFGFIHDVYTSPRSRQSGIGQRLTTALEQAFREQGIELVELHVLEGNEAGRTFWRRSGYNDVIRIMYKKL